MCKTFTQKIIDNKKKRYFVEEIAENNNPKGH